MIKVHNMVNIYIGYDSEQDMAYRVCRYSILKYVKDKNLINPLIQKELREKKIYYRDVDQLGSTEFTFTRFLVPYINNYSGWALFVDCDFLFVSDINELFNMIDNRYAVLVVKHNYMPENNIKMNNKQQHVYPRKNWSSLILYNCAHKSIKNLSLDTVNNKSGSYLHRFEWLPDNEIGEINLEWNWLVNWYSEPKHGKPKGIHFTEGGPWLNNYEFCEYSLLWKQEKNNMLLDREI